MEQCQTGGKEHLAGYLGTVLGRTLRATGEKGSDEQ